MEVETRFSATMVNPNLYRFTGTKPLQWLATMEAYFQYTEEGRMLFPDWSGEERKVWFACKYLDIGDLDRFFQWMEGVTTKYDWEAFKACLVYQFGTFEENCEFDGIEIVYVKQKRAKKELLQKIEQVLEEESIQEIEEEQVLEEEFIKINQENELQRSIQEEEVVEKINLIHDNDSKSMESLDASEFQVSFLQLEPSLQCYSVSMDIYDTTARSLGIEVRTRLQIITEKEYAHHLFDEMTVKKQMLHGKEIRSLFSKCWKFKFKNLLCFPIDQVTQCGILPHLVEFLKKEDFPKLLFEAITAPFAVISSGMGLNQAATNFYSFDQGRMAAYSLFEMITRSSSVANQGAVLASVQGNIEFRNVYFINADYIAVIVEGHLDEMGTHDELINLGGLYAELLKCEEETKFPRRCGALKPLLVQRDSEPSVIALLAVGIKQRMQQPKRKRNSLFPKNWKFKFKNRDLGREKQGWKQSVGAKCELNFQLEWLFFYGSLPRPPEHCKRKI